MTTGVSSINQPQSQALTSLIEKKTSQVKAPEPVIVSNPSKVDEFTKQEPKQLTPEQASAQVYNSINKAQNMMNNPETIGQTVAKCAITLGTFALMTALSFKFMPKIFEKMMGGNSKEVQKVWEDISGAQKLSEMALPESLKNTVEKIKNAITDPETLQKRGGKLTSSILLYGPPGTGKTTFAKAIAKEFPDAKFASIDITKLNSKYHGETGKRINAAIDTICDMAKANPTKKIFVFIDEIDSVMMVDNGPNGKLSNDILNEFKKCFTEKLGKHENIITIGATNLPIRVENGVVEGMADAVAKSGKTLDIPMLNRFGELVLVDLPTSDQLVKALTSHYKGCPLVDAALKSPKDDRVKKLCDFLSQKHHNFSFRNLNNLYNDTASRIQGKTASVKFEDLIETIAQKRVELNISDAEWTGFITSLAA